MRVKIYSNSSFPCQINFFCQSTIYFAILVVFLTASCATKQNITTPVPSPVLSVSSDAINLYYPVKYPANNHASRTTPSFAPRALDAKDKAPVTEIIIKYISTARNFHKPAGPDGYVIQIIPLNNQYHPIEQPADITICLFDDSPYVKNAIKNTKNANRFLREKHYPNAQQKLNTKQSIIKKGPNTSHCQPLMLWHISHTNILRYWMHTVLLDGYVFRLDWDDNPLPPGSYYFDIYFKYLYKEKTIVLYRRIIFQDTRS